MSASTAHGASYFGKLPSRADFVRGGGHVSLIGLLDRWISSAMERLAEDPAWKLRFDEAPTLDFAFVAAHSTVSVVGHFRPSHDLAGRRFPFLTAAMVKRTDGFGPGGAPLAFAGLWAAFRQLSDRAYSCTEPQAAFDALAALDCAATVSSPLAFEGFARATGLDTLAPMLGRDISAEAVRRQILAIGLLLRPLHQGSAQTIDKALCLPLPAAGQAREQVAALWLQLISIMLRGSNFELQLLLGTIGGREHLLVGFDGASPRPLLGFLAPRTLDRSAIVLADPTWIDQHPDLSRDPAVARLSSYLAHHAITVHAAQANFRHVFLGEAP